MKEIKRNIIANYIGSGWTALMGIAFTPVYIYYLGIEAYGVIGVFALMQSWLYILDMGITPTLNREMARFKGGGHTSQGICNLVKSLELIYLLIALTISLVFAFSRVWLSIHWLNINSLPINEVVNALAISGIVISIRWFSGLYRGAITGLQELVWLNSCIAIFSTFRGLGVIIILAFISPTLHAFFIFQAAVTFLEVLVLAIKTHNLLPRPPEPARFDFDALRKVWKFARSMTVNMLQILFLTQVDKLLLSKFLPLSDFGYYTLATTLAGGLYVVMGSITNVAYPQFSLLISRNDHEKLIEAYHKLSRLLAVMIVPASLVTSFFSNNILLLWTHNSSISHAVAPLLSLLVIGNMLNGLTQIPYYLQLANGWTRLNILVNFFSIIVTVPVLYYSIPTYGSISAPIIWIILNAILLIFTIPIMHRKMLTTEMWKWYKYSVIIPVCFALLAVTIIYLVVPTASLEKPLENIFILVTAAIASLSATVFTMPIARVRLGMYMSGFCEILKKSGSSRNLVE